MKFFFFFLLFINFVFAQDNLTIVAVGDAEQEKELIVFSNIEVVGGLTEAQRKDMSNLRQIIVKDFSFYKHKYEIREKNIDKGFSDFKKDKFAEERASYLIAFKAESGTNPVLSAKVYDVRQETFVFNSNLPVPTTENNPRRVAHFMANAIYKSMTEKESIFNSKIVFVTDVHSTKNEMRKELYIMDFDGERRQRLTHNNSMIISPAISPDNSKLLYSVMESRWQKGSGTKPQRVKNLNLYLLDLNTMKSEIVSDKTGINSGAIFDHTGENIYLTLSITGNADIYKMNLATKKLTKVTSHFSDDVDPSINQDGSLMAFLSGRSGRAMIYTMDPNGVEKDVKRISYVGRYNAAPRFSPDGKEIVFSSWVDNRFDLYKIDSNGVNLVRLTKNFGSNEEANFSPDGEFIVFTSLKVESSTRAKQNVYIMNREGEIVAQVTDNFGKSFSPRWSN